MHFAPEKAEMRGGSAASHLDGCTVLVCMNGEAKQETRVAIT